MRADRRQRRTRRDSSAAIRRRRDVRGGRAAALSGAARAAGRRLRRARGLRLRLRRLVGDRRAADDGRGRLRRVLPRERAARRGRRRALRVPPRVQRRKSGGRDDVGRRACPREPRRRPTAAREAVAEATPVVPYAAIACRCSARENVLENSTLRPPGQPRPLTLSRCVDFPFRRWAACERARAACRVC